jgi:ABC-type multidrug transport system fused ATPase/permease subunit
MRALARAQASDERLRGLLDQSPAVASTGSRTPALAAGPVPHLRLTGVGAAWRPGHPALRPLTLDLPPGSHVAVTGANGSGKSTLLAVLARQLDPTSGSYAVDGTDVRDLDLEACRSLFAVVDDEPHVFAGTVRANLRLASPDAPDAALEDALDAAGLHAWRLGLAEGLDTRLGTGGVGVSGGERARLGIARALLSQRPVLLLDEPVAHLDHPTAASVVRDLFAAGTGRTVVLVSHRPEGLDEAGRIMDLSAVAATTTGR